MDAEREAGHHAEVSAPAAAQGPVQIRVLVRADSKQAAVGRDDSGTDEVVGGEPELASGQAHAATQGVAGDADRRARAGRDRDARAASAAYRVDQLGPAADGRGAGVRVDGDAAEVAEVEHHPARQRGVAGVAVAARACAQRNVV
jgi:hypothetical protein